MERVPSIATYAASGGAIIFGLTANELYALVGLFLAAATFVTNLWFKYKGLQLQRDFYKLELSELKEQHNVDRRATKRNHAKLPAP